MDRYLHCALLNGVINCTIFRYFCFGADHHEACWHRYSRYYHCYFFI